MKMNKIILGLAVALSTSLTYGQIDRSIVPTPKAAPEISIADPVVFDLDNGMKVILSTNTKIPKVSFNLVMGSDPALEGNKAGLDRKSTRLNSSHVRTSYAVFCLKKKKKKTN